MLHTSLPKTITTPTAQLSGWCSKVGTALGTFSGIVQVVRDRLADIGLIDGLCVKVLNSIQISIRMEGHLKHQLD